MITNTAALKDKNAPLEGLLSMVTKLRKRQKHQRQEKWRLRRRGKDYTKGKKSDDLEGKERTTSKATKATTPKARKVTT